LAGTNKKSFDLEKSIGELEKIVEELEAGELSLDKSLKQFEKGVRLSRECQAALKDTEQKVQILVDSELKATDADSLSERDN
jgi:exodeoxyribonuclease VII small subunit